MSTIKKSETSEVTDESKSAEELAFEACEDAIRTVECPSRHSLAEYRWHRLARMALEKRATPPLSSGISMIAEERQRQQDREGYTNGHDAGHDQSELAWAAAAYAAPGPVVHKENGDDIWPWGPESDKRTKHSRCKRLIIAGALCAAEIDRLQQQEGQR